MVSRPLLSRLPLVFLGSATLGAQQRPLTVTEETRQIEALASAYHDAGLFSGALLVARDGVVLLERGFGLANLEWNIRNAPGTRFAIGSLTKQFTALAVMQLVEDGSLRLDAPIGAYLPGLRQDVGQRVTLHHLLGHTSGLAGETAYMLERHTDRAVPRDTLFSLINRQEPVVPPGQEFSYNNVNYILLSWIVEAVTGRDFASYLRERVLDPLGMRSTGFRPPRGFLPGAAVSYARLRGRTELPEALDDSWYPGAGGLWSTVRDLRAWDQALYTQTLLPDSAIRRLFTPGPAGYGYGWSIGRYGAAGHQGTVVYHEGGGPSGAAIIRRYLEDRLLIVALSNTRSSQVAALAQQVANALLGGVVRLPGMPIDDELQATLFDRGLDSALALYGAARADPTRRAPGAGTLNRMAYEFLRTGRVAEALQLFRLEVALYPIAANAWDSFAEAWLVAGQRDSAVQCYRRAVELDLGSLNALFMLRQLGVTEPAAISSPLLRAILDAGVDTALARYHQMRGTADTLGEDYVNTVAYTLLRHGRPQEALPLLQFNATAHPASWNVWDSLGEGYMVLGQREEAVRCYRRSLELNPRNENGIEMLRRLGVERPPPDR